MAHKTLVGGTAYEIKGGKTLVGGTAYEIKGGKTLVGGTAYGIKFVEKVTITISNTDSVGNAIKPNTTYAKFTINGKVYDSSEAVSVIVDEGTVIECYVSAYATVGSYMVYDWAGVFLNGEKLVKLDEDNTSATYMYTVKTNATIFATTQEFFGNFAGIIHITES